jgi:hypothetical protein
MCDGKPEKPWSQNHWGAWVSIKAQAWLILVVDTLGLRYDPTHGAVWYKRYDCKSRAFKKGGASGQRHEGDDNFGAHVFYR